ncbi:MAG: hypothetical protein VX700_11365 [Pseudomonadota bacterium]|nr:hypothetical protein [Pseudomonadota bacterium]
MSLWSDLLTEALRHASGDTLGSLQRLEVAVRTGTVTRLESNLHFCVQRVEQANKKIAAGADIARMSELLTLARYGAGSIGKGVGEIFGATKIAPELEAIFVAKFLTVMIIQRRKYHALFPADLLQKHSVQRSKLEEPSAGPVLCDILERAKSSAAQFPGYNARYINRKTQIMLTYEKKLLAKRLSRLSANPFAQNPINLGVWDRFVCALNLRLLKLPSP